MGLVRITSIKTNCTATHCEKQPVGHCAICNGSRVALQYMFYTVCTDQLDLTCCCTTLSKIFETVHIGM